MSRVGYGGNEWRPGAAETRVTSPDVTPTAWPWGSLHGAVQKQHCAWCCAGGAGVGKSYTIEVLVQQLQAMRRTVGITASTGTAALNINGMTVHR